MKSGGKFIAGQRGAFQSSEKPAPMPKKGKLSPAMAAKIREKANRILGSGI